MTASNAEEPTPSIDGALMGGAKDGAAYRALLVGNRRFRNLFFAMLTSSLGDWIGVIAILELTKDILGTTRAAGLAVSAVMIARVVPTLLLGPIAGVFVDRWDRKRVMIVTDIGRGLVMASLAFSADLVHLIIGTLMIEVMSTLFGPAKDATLPNLVPPE
ncbi:MAG: dTMP kinase, partial [Glaciecola sp.]